MVPLPAGRAVEEALLDDPLPVHVQPLLGRQEVRASPLGSAQLLLHVSDLTLVIRECVLDSWMSDGWVTLVAVLHMYGWRIGDGAVGVF